MTTDRSSDLDQSASCPQRVLIEVTDEGPALINEDGERFPATETEPGVYRISYSSRTGSESVEEVILQRRSRAPERLTMRNEYRFYGDRLGSLLALLTLTVASSISLFATILVIWKHGANIDSSGVAVTVSLVLINCICCWLIFHFRRSTRIRRQGYRAARLITDWADLESSLRDLSAERLGLSRDACQRVPLTMIMDGLVHAGVVEVDFVDRAVPLLQFRNQIVHTPFRFLDSHKLEKASEDLVSLRKAVKAGSTFQTGQVRTQ